MKPHMPYPSLFGTRSCLQGLLIQFPIASAFAFSAVAGSVTLSAGEARASAITCFPASVNYMDPMFSGSVTNTLSGGNTISASSRNCQVDRTNLVYPNNQTSVSIAYTPTNLTGADTFSYTFTSDRSDAFFDRVSLSFADANPQNVETVVKNVYDPLSGKLLASLTTQNSSVSQDLGGLYQSLYIEDIINANGAEGGSISRVTDSFRQVPGPLPILGAGTAFGFSRKLRRRIKAARLS